MKKTILAFGASNSRQSINKKLASFASEQIPDADIILLDLNDFEMPIYSIDREKEEGIPQQAYDFKALVKQADGILISFAEHNGAYTVAFKNIFDWTSRIERDVWANKPMFLLATSPGRRGAKSVLQIAETRFRFMNQNFITTFSLPSFRENFEEGRGITQEGLLQVFHAELREFRKALESDSGE